MSSDVTLGSIYWPITQPLNILRSEKIPFPSSELFSNSRKVYCPHLIDDKNSHVCMLKKESNNKCGYKDSSGTCCDYDDYHNLFLLLKKGSNNGNRDSLKPFDEIPVPNPETYSKLYSSSKHTHFTTTLNAFPQTDQSKLIGWKVFNSPLNDGVFFNIPPSYTKGKKQLRADVGFGSLGKNDIVYAKTELLRLEKMDDIDAFMDAFLLLVKKDKIKQLLPPDIIKKPVEQKDIVFPVQLSFFADKKIDAILALCIRTKEKDIIKNAKLVRQALGSMREVIYNQRQEFLEKWCMRLGERVDDIVQKSNPENPENHNQAIKKAMKFALKAIFNMAQTLAVQHSGCNIKKISEVFDYETDKKKKNPEQIFKCIDDNFIGTGKLDEDCVDRKKYVIDFCKKAEMYAEEFVASEGKLKGRLSALTVRKLKKISLTSNPVNARILIRGKPGGGKGVTADDFHFYCMKKIAEEIQNIKEDWIKNIIENIIDTLGEQSSVDVNKKMGELRGDPFEFLKEAYPKPLEKHKSTVGRKSPIKEECLKEIREIKKDRIEKIVEDVFDVLEGGSDDENSKKDSVTDLHTYLIEHSEYLKEIEKRLKAIFKLPANYSTSTPGASAILFFRQISNTSWWLWDQSTNASSLKEDIDELLKIQKKVIDKSTTSAGGDYFKEEQKGHEDYLIKEFTKLLKRKIIMEIESEKPDFSFNLLQVNCGILGGENSELTESIARLFGKCGDYDTAIPGLFQTCSYMGGTLFLDEIADCPVRVQDNLLKPLEEGTVSRPGWETFDEKVDNIRVVGATFKDLFKLAKQYEETFPSGNPKGFRPDLLTRLTRNPPVSVRPISHYFVPTEPIDSDFKSQFAFVCNSTWVVSPAFWGKVYDKVFQKIDEHVHKARYHIPDVPAGRRKFASKITMRLFKEVGKIAQLNNNPKLPDNNFTQKNKALEYLNRMLDYLLVETS